MADTAKYPSLSSDDDHRAPLKTCENAEALRHSWERVIIGIDPGTNVMGYGILGINGKTPSMIAMGVIKLSKFESHYLRLRRIHSRVLGLVEQYLPDEMAIEEYEPRKIKMAITGSGAASKEQVQEMLRRILNIDRGQLLPELDATDALAAALCHFYETSRPTVTAGPKSWKEFIAKNPGRIKQ